MGPRKTMEAAILRGLADAVIVRGEDGTFAFVNDAAARLLGETPCALLGRDAASLVPEALRTVDGTPFFDWLAAREVARAPIRRRDGVEIRRVLRTSRLEAEGALVVVLQSPADELPRDADPKAETSYRAVFDAVPVGVLHFDARARITACNDVFVSQMGSSRDLLIGLDMLTLPDPDVKRAVREALAGRDGHFEGEYTSVTGGRRRIHRALFSPIVSEGRVQGGVGIVDDITERREIQVRLAHGERMASLGRLAAGVAHEINNPLAYVRTSLDLAAREVSRLESGHAGASLARVRELLSHADDGVERMRVIVSDLKTFSRGDDGSWIPVELARVVDAAVNLTWNEIRHRAELVREIEDVPRVMGTESRYVQVVVNLLLNASQAIEEGHAQRHRITVRIGRASEDRVFLEVEDTGSGMEAERAAHVFEPFWTSKPTGVGMGLGLSICHGIVTAAGGEIRVARSRPGEGTTFRVELPAAPTASARSSAPPVAPEEPATPRRGRVLIVDDEPKLGTTLALALGDSFDVRVVASGREALQVLEAGGAFDVVLCDLMMPEMSGMDVYERVLQEQPHLASRFVFMTGGAFTERAREFLRARRLRRIEKPFTIERVERVLLEVQQAEE